MMRPSLGFWYESITYPEMFGAKKNPQMLKKIYPNAEDVLYCSFFALEINTPKQVGTIVAPRSKSAHSPIEKW